MHFAARGYVSAFLVACFVGGVAISARADDDDTPQPTTHSRHVISGDDQPSTDSDSAPKPADDSSAKSVDEAAPTPAPADAAPKPADDSATKPADDATPKPADDSAAKPADDATPKPADDSAAKPADDSPKPADDSAAKPADDSASGNAADAPKPADADKPPAEEKAADTAPADNAGPPAEKAADSAPAQDTDKTAGSEKAPDQKPAADSEPAPGTLAPSKTPVGEGKDEGEAQDQTEQKTEQAPPSAAKTKKIAILPFAAVNGDAPQTTGDKVTEMLRDEVTKAGELLIVDVGAQDTSAKNPGEEELAKAKKQLAVAIAQLDKVKSLLARRKIKPAADADERGIKAFLANFQGADDFKPLSNAYARLAVIRFMLGNDDASTRAFDDLIRIDPTRTLTVADLKELTGQDVSDDLVGRFRAERKALIAKAGGGIRIDSTPAGGRVAIDGAAVGESPLLAKSLIPGDHYVVVTKEGAGAFWKQVSIKGSSVTVTAQLTTEATGPLADITRKMARNIADDTTRGNIQAAGQALGVDYIVFGGIHPDGDTLIAKTYLMRISDGGVAQLVGISLDPSLLGAGIEIVKVANDLSAKYHADDFPAPTLTALFDGVSSKAESVVAATEVVITPPLGESGRSSEGGEVAGGETHRRGHGPVSADDEEQPQQPVKKVEKAPTNGSALEELEARRAARAKKQQGRAISSDEDNGPTETPPPEKSDDNTEGNNVDIKPPTPEAEHAAGLTPEQLAAIQRANNGGSHTTTIVVWTTVGTVVAAGVIVAAVLLSRPTNPSSATLNVHW